MCYGMHLLNWLSLVFSCCLTVVLMCWLVVMIVVCIGEFFLCLICHTFFNMSNFHRVNNKARTNSVPLVPLSGYLIRHKHQKTSSESGEVELKKHLG